MSGSARLLAAAGCFALAFSVQAAAQTEEDFIAAFSGDWETFQAAVEASEAPCRVSLSDSGGSDSGLYDLAQEGCDGIVGEAVAWGIDQRQLAFFGREREVLARLGGSQNRMTGDTAAGHAIVFERAGAAQAAVTAEDVAGGACLYLGYTASCAEPEDLAPVEMEAEGELPAVSVMVDLNARAEPRPDAEVVEVIGKNTCVAVSQCVNASDGRWCEVRIETAEAWIRQQAVRAAKWPVLTYRAGC